MKAAVSTPLSKVLAKALRDAEPEELNQLATELHGWSVIIDAKAQESQKHRDPSMRGPYTNSFEFIDLLNRRLSEAP